ncbi:PREDICTED: cyclin-A1-1 [Fragaria vesca subsp. vesca]|uniref:cyclin-A1-1 n=1 Tax=Fragaria vesca subsp. vesca TaxID=101020 RepID=UPI0002C301D2|nr:PREDICTED: cyclin-A1-1 [Fragaria vesca subsp. vesca]
MSSTQNRRSGFPSSSLAKRQASSSSSNVGKFPVAEPRLAKKRAPLSNLTNRSNVGAGSASKSALVPCKIAKVKKGSPASTSNRGISGSNVPAASCSVKPSTIVLPKVTAVQRSDEVFPKSTSVQRSGEAAPISVVIPVPCNMDESPSKSDGDSVSMDETMSTCDSFKSPQVEYIDNNDVQAIDSINRKTFSHLHISDQPETTGIVCSRELLVELEGDGSVADIDNRFMDPQLCATFACDIYKHLRASEVKKRPSTDYMDKIQKDINPSMRAILVDWLVEVAEEYRLVPDTLYLTVNYIDRYLTGNPMNRQRLQLLGVACMMIASKYEEICAPQVEEFCYITDNTYFKEEVLEMESSVLNYLKFEMTAATTKCFLRRFVRAAQGVNELPSMQLECLANYLAELSLLDYSMLSYAPSLVAASAIFLANYITLPSKRPWNATLQHYTLYQPSDLRECVKDLHRLCCDNQNSSLPAIREKYSQHKYKYVAKMYCPPTIPKEYQA